MDINDNKCIICYEDNNNKIQYFKCSKYHNLCRVCFYKHITINKINTGCSNKCPICKAEFTNECISPTLLSVPEICNINIRNIITRNIYVHQTFTLSPYYKPITINYGKDKTISLYMDNGMIATYMGMFIGTNGFLYDYDRRYGVYMLSINKDKYQFWDNSKMHIEIN